MQDSAIQAFRPLRRSERILDIHCKAGDEARVETALAMVESDSAAFDAATPATRRGIAIKAAEAIRTLEVEHASAAELLRKFFRKRAPIDGQWLRDLRDRMLAVELMAPRCHYAARCIASILAGASRPHAV